MAVPLRGGGVKRLPDKKTNFLCGTLKNKQTNPTDIKLGGGG